MRSSKTNNNVDSPEMTNVSWAGLLAEVHQHLTVASVGGDPRVEARWLIEEATGTTGTEFHDVLSDLATVRGVAHVDDMVRRRSSGEPIQYVLGHWAFRHLDLFVDRRVLIPRPETEVLVDHAIRELDRLRPDGRGLVVDLGTGSGAIGLSVAKERPGTRVVLTERSADALAVARANLAGLGISGGSVEIFEGSWFEPLAERFLGEFDVVAANPPYVRADAELAPSVADWEPSEALISGSDGLDDLRVIVEGVSPWLRPTGALVLEMDPAQSRAIVELAATFDFDAEVHADLAGAERIVVARRRR